MRRILIALASTFAVTIGLFQADAHSRSAEEPVAGGSAGPNAPAGPAPAGGSTGSGSGAGQGQQPGQGGQDGQAPQPGQDGQNGQDGQDGQNGQGQGQGQQPGQPGQNGQGQQPDQGGSAVTYTGEAVQTRYGPVQVQVVVTDGQVTSVKGIDFPWNNPRDQAINGHAVPILDREATQARSAQIDAVSGATYPSRAYVGSLQSALDEAGL